MIIHDLKHPTESLISTLQISGLRLNEAKQNLEQIEQKQ